MSKALRHPELAFVVCRQDFAHPLAKGGGRFADVYRYIKHLALHHAHELALRLLDLVMQTAQHALGGAGVIVLHKGNRLADGGFKLGLVEALIKKPRSSPNTLDSNKTTSGMARGWLSSEHLLLEHT